MGSAVIKTVMCTLSLLCNFIKMSGTKDILGMVPMHFCIKFIDHSEFLSK